MKRIQILYINDEPADREEFRSKIGFIDSNFEVIAPIGTKTEDLMYETFEILNANDTIFDILVLDIKLGRDYQGGLVLYDEISKKYKNKWVNLIVCSRFKKATKSDHNESIADEKVKNFLLANGFQFNNYIWGVETLIERIKSLTQT